MCRVVKFLIDARILKIQISKAGGTAAEGSKSYKMSIPSKWAKQLQLDSEHRELAVSFDGSTITVQRKADIDLITSEMNELSEKIKKYI